MEGYVHINCKVCKTDFWTYFRNCGVIGDRHWSSSYM